MADAGWYPDPGGAPGRYRYWDGRAWSPSTSPTPGGPAPGVPRGAVPPGGPGRRRRPGPWIALAALLVVVVVVAALVVRGRPGPDVADPFPSAGTGTGGGGDDRSPTPTPTPSATKTPSAVPTPTPPGTGPTPGSPAPSRPDEPCPVGDPRARQPHPDDGRIHGGGLSIPGQGGWTTPGLQVAGFSWAYDVGEADLRVQPRWFAAYAVGALSVADGFEAPQPAAERVMACTVGSAFYRGVTGVRELVSQPVTVDGHRGWTVRSEVRVDNDQTTYAGDVVQVTVVDVGSPESLAFFEACAPIDHRPLLARLDRTAADLRVD